MERERPVLDQLNLVVSDMEATVAFYRVLGLEIPDTLPVWAPDHRNAETGSGIDLDFDSAGFAAKWDRGWPGGSGSVLGFRVSSREAVDATFAALMEAGYPASQAPYDAFWGARYAVVVDPDGRHVGIMSPRDPAFASAGPA